MTIKEIQGDLFESKTDVIAHQVNCQRTMGSGVAKTVRERFPKVYEDYLRTPGKLGEILVSEDKGRRIANLYGQYYYLGCMIEDGKDWKEKPDDDGPVFRYTNYEALYRSLEKLKKYMVSNNLNSVAFPYALGSSRGGGEWPIVYELIKSAFEGTDIEVEIWKL